MPTPPASTRAYAVRGCENVGTGIPPSEAVAARAKIFASAEMAYRSRASSAVLNVRATSSSGRRVGIGKEIADAERRNRFARERRPGGTAAAAAAAAAPRFSSVSCREWDSDCAARFRICDRPRPRPSRAVRNPRSRRRSLRRLIRRASRSLSRRSRFPGRRGYRSRGYHSRWPRRANRPRRSPSRPQIPRPSRRRRLLRRRSASSFYPRR